MPKAIKDPGVNGSEKPRPEPFYSLRKRNERRAQVAQLLETRRERRLEVERVVQAQAQRRSRHGG